MKKLIVRFNEEKKVFKKLGFTVDGKYYKVEFKKGKRVSVEWNWFFYLIVCILFVKLLIIIVYLVIVIVRFDYL